MFRKSGPSRPLVYKNWRRAKHWYRDNTIYFITARCRDQIRAFQGEAPKTIFWNRFDEYTEQFEFKPIVISLLDNHYHLIGYLKKGENLAPFMQHLHGAVAKLVNDQRQERLLPFWRNGRGQSYFDGCIRNEKQFRGAYRYTQTQSQRHGICPDYRTYQHTRTCVPMEKALKRAQELNAFLPEVAYRRYQTHLKK